MGFFNSMNISGSGLTAQSLRLDVIAENIANVDTTRTEDGTPYQRKTVVLGEQQASFSSQMSRAQAGVVVREIARDPAAGELVYNPDHPDADDFGYVEMPNVDITTEYVDLISASRSYEANLTVMNSAKRMAVKALEIGR